MSKQLWNSQVSGSWSCKAGRCQTVVASHDQRTGKPTWHWVAFSSSGQNLGSFKSLAQAKKAVEASV